MHEGNRGVGGDVQPKNSSSRIRESEKKSTLQFQHNQIMMIRKAENFVESTFQPVENLQNKCVNTSNKFRKKVCKT